MEQVIIYSYPSSVYLLLFIPIFAYLFYYRYRQREKILKQFAEPNVLERSATSPSLFWVISRRCLLLFSWALLTFALMGPKGNPHYPVGFLQEEGKGEYTVRRKAHEMTFLLDISKSMQTKDARLGKSRLEYAKDIIEEMLSQVQGESVALYTFTASVDKRIPHTMDYVYFRLNLREIKGNLNQIPGTDFNEVLSTVLADMTKSEPSKIKTLVVLSDGEDTSKNKARSLQVAKQLIQKAESSNLRIYTVGLGTKSGQEVPELQVSGKAVKSKLDDTLLKELAEARGKYYLANQYTPLNLAKQIMDEARQDDPYIRTAQVIHSSKPEILIYDQYYQYPLIAALVLGLLSFLLPGTNRLTKEDQW